MTGATRLARTAKHATTDAPKGPDLVCVKDLSVEFSGAGREKVRAVDEVSFSLPPGGRLGIVGESGSGKTVTVSALMGLFAEGADVTGEVFITGRRLLSLPAEELRAIRGAEVALVPQEPTTAFSPVRRIGTQMVETLRAHRQVSRQEARRLSEQALARVQVPSPRRQLAAYPYELSGGMLQRVCIATALLCEPALLIADEATTALDVSVQASILELLDQVAQERSMALVVVSHDISVIAGLCETAAVMYAGRIVESGATDRLFSSPRHPYTAALLECRPSLDRGARQRLLVTVRGQQEPGAATLPGCAFAPRCAFATKQCTGERPLLESVSDRHSSACWRSAEWHKFVQGEGRVLRPVLAGPRALVSAAANSGPLLQARGLSVVYPTRQPGSFRRIHLRAVDGVSLDILPGRTLGLVGESGSGKSTVGRAVLGLQRPDEGTIHFAGYDLNHLDRTTLRVLRKRMQLVLQSSFHTFDPRHTLGDALAEAVRLRPEARRRLAARVAELFEMVELPSRVTRAFPAELSGGQRQRAAIARALATAPELVVADEPTSALDVSVRAGILNLLRRLQADQGISYLFISHDLAAVRSMSDEVAVMYFGRIVESGPADEVFEHPAHPYTRALLDAVPKPASGPALRQSAIPGEVPSLFDPPSGCPFHPRCPRATLECREAYPELEPVGPVHEAACIHPMAAEGKEGS